MESCLRYRLLDVLLVLTHRRLYRVHLLLLLLLQLCERVAEREIVELRMCIIDE